MSMRHVFSLVVAQGDERQAHFPGPRRRLVASARLIYVSLTPPQVASTLASMWARMVS